MKRIFSYMIRRTKDDWKATKEDFRGIKDDWKRIDAKSDERIAEKQRKANEKIAKMRAESKNAPTFRETLAEAREVFVESREKQRKKEAERNPGMFMRVWSGTVSILFLILSVPLALSIIGIPFAIGLIALAIYFWRKDVIKKPYEYKPKEDNENVGN